MTSAPANASAWVGATLIDGGGDAYEVVGVEFRLRRGGRLVRVPGEDIHAYLASGGWQLQLNKAESKTKPYASAVPAIGSQKEER